jgi:hypothetical protein
LWRFKQRPGTRKITRRLTPLAKEVAVVITVEELAIAPRWPVV